MFQPVWSQTVDAASQSFQVTMRSKVSIQPLTSTWKFLWKRFHGLLKESQRQVNEEQWRMNPIKKELEIQGHRYAKENEKVRLFDYNPLFVWKNSFVNLPSNNKYGMSSTSMGYSHFQTPRVRSAYPTKKEVQPIRIRSAHPLKSPPLPVIGLRTGARSGNANERTYYRPRSPSKNADYMKILDETARLSIQKSMSVTAGDVPAFSHKSISPSKNYTQLKRIKLQPSALPKFTDSVTETTTTILPPLAEAKNSHPLRSKVKPKTNPAALVTNLKSANGKMNGSENLVGRKPTSAVQPNRSIASQSKLGQQHRQMYNIPPSTYRTGNSIELVGTSLSLFDPIARCVRPISIPKLRTHFWSPRGISLLYYLGKYLVFKLSSHEKIAIEQKKVQPVPCRGSYLP